VEQWVGRSPEDRDEDAALRALVEGTATETGEGFFHALVESLARVLGTQGAWVTEYLADTRRLRALAFWLDGGFIDHYEYDIAGTPCEPVIDHAKLVHYPDRIVELYPEDPDLRAQRAVSYMGVPLTDVDGTILGHLAVLDTKAMPEAPRAQALMRIFASRAAAELQRLRAETRLREREERLRALVDGALDAIVELDAELAITAANPAARTLFGWTEEPQAGTSFPGRLESASAQRLSALVEELRRDTGGAGHIWVGGGLEARRADGKPLTLEASLSRFEARGREHFTLILRDLEEKLEAERQLRVLAEEADYLREELRAGQDFGGIVGRSRALRRVLADVAEVGPADATVLLTGETGTGKELFARAIHEASGRSRRPLVKVNCAAIPANLIESELFGHERGAFTGATQRREGRFSLADGGTIFLDEVGELPLELQPKLLRVLQEGEFEPVGSSRTKSVDVRVVSATNVDLDQAVKEGAFREDLYYRLNVFPIRLPPLRERGDDVVLLAEAFARRFARRSGRCLLPLGDADARRLEAYHWPGNVRELQNVIERAVITSRDGRLNLARALPLPEGAPHAAESGGGETPGRLLTEAEVRELERENLRRALERAGWKVSGDGGAAGLLGVSPSTLSSRMKALGLRRPRRD
jgi:PAS domain S-box-containing protein